MTTLGIDGRLFEDNHADAMAALGALSARAQATGYSNVIPLHG